MKFKITLISFPINFWVFANHSALSLLLPDPENVPAFHHSIPLFTRTPIQIAFKLFDKFFLFL